MKPSSPKIPPKASLAGISFDNLTMDETLSQIEAYITAGQRAHVIPVNVNVAVKADQDPGLARAIEGAELVLADGQPLIWLARRFASPLKEKVSGSDLVPLLCKRAAEKGYSIFLFGGEEGVGDKAKANLQAALPGLNVAGTYSPPFGFEKDPEQLKAAIDEINRVSPDVLVICLGCPKQEKFLCENAERLSARVSVCAGATLDFIAEKVSRAPRWMSRYGLEWLYRFLHEPKRLFRRYFIENMRIWGLARRHRPKR